MKRSIGLALCALLAACSDAEDAGPVRVDRIGEAPTLADPVRVAPSDTGALVLDALAQGLVGLDAEGEVEPALAKRWIVLDAGLTYIFRLDDFVWRDGTALTAGQVARQLRAIGSSRNNRLASLLADIEDIEAVTPQILEIRLRRPRTDFLNLLAQPDLALVIGGEGLGPFTLADGYALDGDGAVLLSPYRSPPEADEEEDAEPPEPVAPEETVELTFAPSAEAVARFGLGQTDLVLGGRWTNLPHARTIDLPADRLVFDPTDGLFGLAFVEQNGFLADAGNRRLLSITVDRRALATAFGDEAIVRNLIVPADAEDIGMRVPPTWLDTDIEARRQFGRASVNIWEATNGPINPIRVALPDDPASRVIFAVIQGSWRRIGIEAERVALDDDADLRLIDSIAATPSAGWYVNFFRCGDRYPCSEELVQAFDLIADARSQRVYEIRIAEAAVELEAVTPFIPLLRPIRWSLVSPRIAGFRANRYAVHPLDRLVDSTD